MERKPLYKVGSVVELNSGGPPMTVKEVNDNKNAKPPDPDDDLLASFGKKPQPWVKPSRKIWYRCTWFAGKKNQEGVFDEETIHQSPDKS